MTTTSGDKEQSAEEAAKQYCDVQVGDKAKLISDRSIDACDDIYDGFIAGAKFPNKAKDEEIERLNKRLESESSVYIAMLESSNKELLEALNESNLQIEYLHKKFRKTASGKAVLSRNQSLISRLEDGSNNIKE